MLVVDSFKEIECEPTSVQRGMTYVRETQAQDLTETEAMVFNVTDDVDDQLEEATATGIKLFRSN